MMKKKKHSRSQSSTTKSLGSSPEPSPRLLAVIRSKLASGKELKNMFRGMRSKTIPGLSSQSRIVRCPNCHKLLQEPLDATSYKCGGCDSILHAKRLELEGNDNTVPKALLSSQNHSLGSKVESAEGGYKSRASASSSRSKTVYKHETSDIRREWMRRANEFSATGDSDMYNSQSNASKWLEQEERYEDLPRVAFYPASPSPSSAYEYGYNSPYHGSQVSASEKSYYHHHPNQFKQGWFQEVSGASPIRSHGESESDGKYYHWSSQSQLHDLQYLNLYESSSSATPHHSVYSERSYQTAAAPHRYTSSETSSDKSTSRDKNRYVRERKPVVKRHVLPSGGGAPFVTCSYCLELLQLPQVSLHGKHKRYQVRCGSCSGVLKFSIGEKVDNVLDSPSLVDSGTGFVDETVIVHQDSVSEGHEEMHPDESHMSCSDNESGDTICKSNDHVVLSRSLETCADKGNDEMHQHASSESIGETSRIHIEQSKEAHSKMLHEILATKISEGIMYDLEESGSEKNETLNPEEVVGDGSGELLSEIVVYKKEMMSESSLEAETVAERLISHSTEPLNKKDNVCETQVLSEHTRDTQELDWKGTEKTEAYGSESTWEEIMEDKPRLDLEKSQNIEDFIYDSSSSNNETFKDRTVKEETGHMSNTFSDVAISGEATTIISRIHGKQSQDSKLEEFQYDYENLSESQELDKAIADIVRYELEESLYETNETLEEDGSVVFPEKASEMFESIIEGEKAEERLVSRPQDKTLENSYGTLEQVYLQGRGYAGERTWPEAEEARAGLHLEEYESNYENYCKPLECTSETAPTFHMHEDELGTILEPEEDVDGRSESSSRGSFSDHESSEENAVFHESQDAKPDQAQSESENSSERQELSNTIFDIVRSESQECRYKTSETLELGEMVRVESVVSLEKASETIMEETSEERSVTHQRKPQENVEPAYLEVSGYAGERICAETMGDGSGLELEECESNPFEWPSQRAPTFRLHEYEQETMLETDEDANGGPVSNSRDTFIDHESLEDKAVSQEEEPWIVDENEIEVVKVVVTMKDGPLDHLEKSENESTILEETFVCTMLESDKDVESSSRGSSSNLESSKARDVFHEEPQLVNDIRTDEQYISEMVEDGPSLLLEKSENEREKLDETFEWTAGRSLTFRLHENELDTMLERCEDANGVSESSSRTSFNEHGSSNERTMNHEEELLQEDEHALHLKEGNTETMELEETLEPRDAIFTLNPHNTLEQENMMFHLEMSQDKQSLEQGKAQEEKLESGSRDAIFSLSPQNTLEQENMMFHLEMPQDKQSLDQGKAQEEKLESGSSVSLEEQETSSKIAEEDSEAEEERLSSVPYPQLYCPPEPIEVVGLLHALYEPQTSSPLRSPLTSPIHTPIGSPLHYLMSSQIRSPIPSQMHSHIVSPLRSPIISSGSLSDVLFFKLDDRKTDTSKLA